MCINPVQRDSGLDLERASLSNMGPVTPLALAAVRSFSFASMISFSLLRRLVARCLIISALSSGARELNFLLPDLAFLARTETLVPSTSRGENMAPIFSPAMMLLMVLYFIPLQMITLQPWSRANPADFTFDSIPPVPKFDLSPNFILFVFFGLK